ncbi:hypothetical protein N9L92_04425 [Saprospiraceae bacterium]|nr:hypothetical protein [Saprospiraceae bacterium]
MELRKLLIDINDLSLRWHSSSEESYKTGGEDFDARLLIAEYILSKGYDINVGNHKASRLVQIFLDQEVGQNEEAYCGSEEDMLDNFIQMFSNPDDSNLTLIDDYPIEGIYKSVKNVDKDIYMAINYYESKFWPEQIKFNYNLEDF